MYFTCKNIKVLILKILLENFPREENLVLDQNQKNTL